MQGQAVENRSLDALHAHVGHGVERARNHPMAARRGAKQHRESGNEKHDQGQNPDQNTTYPDHLKMPAPG